MEPSDRITPRQDVLLDTECGNVEAVDHVLRGHDHTDIAAHWNVQFVDLALTLDVLELPHPLLSDGVDVGRILGRRAFLKINSRCPNEDKQENAERNDGPGEFQGIGAFDLLRIMSGATPIAHRKYHDHGENGHAHDRGNGDQENVECVHISGGGRGSCRPQWEVFKHSYLIRSTPDKRCAASRRNMTMMKPANSNMVATPARRSTRLIMSPYFPAAGS